MDTKERARIATAAATRARRMTKWRRWAAEMRENGFEVKEPDLLCGAIYVDPRGERPAQPPCGKHRGHENGPETDWKRGYHSNGSLKWLVDEQEPEGPMEPGGLFGDGMK